jgi:hypothetical protein
LPEVFERTNFPIHFPIQEMRELRLYLYRSIPAVQKPFPRKKLKGPNPVKIAECGPICRP